MKIFERRIPHRRGARKTCAMDRKTCGNCGRRSKEGETFNHCSRCKVVAYCSKACQVHHWKNGHKQACQDAREREEDMMKKQNKTVDGGGASKRPGKPRKPKKSSSSSGRGAAVEELKPKPPRQSARVDALVGLSEGKKELSFGENENCGICLDRFRTPVKLLCGHRYCKECIEGVRQRKSLPDSCPVCREPLPPGAAQLLDKGWQKYMKVQRAVERGGRGWGKLPRKVQEEMDAVHALWRMAAEQAHAQAQYNLGVHYDHGKGVAQDFTAAREWYEKAASQGHADALYSLGYLYDHGPWLRTSRQPGNGTRKQRPKNRSVRYTA